MPYPLLFLWAYGEGAHPPGAERFAPRRDLLLPPVLAVEEGAHPPGAYFSHAGKVGKRALRGSTPKYPSFGDQGRGGVYISNGIGSGITYEPW